MTLDETGRFSCAPYSVSAVSTLVSAVLCSRSAVLVIQQYFDVTPCHHTWASFKLSGGCSSLSLLFRQLVSHYWHSIKLQENLFWPNSVLHLTCTNPNILNSKQEQQTVPLANAEGPLLACAVQPPATCLPLPVCSPAPVCSCLYSPVPQELTESQKT